MRKIALMWGDDLYGEIALYNQKRWPKSDRMYGIAIGPVFIGFTILFDRPATPQQGGRPAD